MRRVLIIAFVLLLPMGIVAQQLTHEQMVGLLEKDGCVTLEASKVRICRADYQFGGGRGS